MIHEIDFGCSAEARTQFRPPGLWTQSGHSLFIGRTKRQGLKEAGRTHLLRCTKEVIAIAAQGESVRHIDAEQGHRHGCTAHGRGVPATYRSRLISLDENTVTNPPGAWDLERLSSFGLCWKWYLFVGRAMRLWRAFMVRN